MESLEYLASVVLGDPTLRDRLSPRSIERLGEQWVWANTTPEQRAEREKDRKFKEWAKKNKTVGWVPTARDLQGERVLK